SSGVFNRAFYLLSNTDGWDPRKAFEIMLKANQNYWVNSTDFIDGACGAINSAIDLSYKAIDVITAFQHVGISCDNIQFVD
ncbi:M4 family metallopeptidase, partial [Streptomyces galilaeus]|uniref:M4 family metallopeptidase n=1 Tax=Streptomyces galilaeus TaxID=33899 RepID=UPI0038F7EA3E